MSIQKTSQKAGASRNRATPWGRADSIKAIGESGIYFATTPSHGGFFVPTELLAAIPEAHQKRAAYWSGSRNWYEEDCEWASVVNAFPHLFDDQMRADATATLQWRDAREVNQQGAL
jgi:hypothetical protein